MRLQRTVLTVILSLGIGRAWGLGTPTFVDLARLVSIARQNGTFPALHAE